MRRISLKSILCVVFCAGIGVCLSVCAPPLDLASYVEDDDVSGIIDRGDGKVTLIYDTLAELADLQEGNKEISGLDPTLYYIVEEWETREAIKTDTPNIQFVTPTGARSDHLTDIGRVAGGRITGLTNRFYYRVTVARPLSSGSALYSVPFDVLTPPNIPPRPPATNVAGVIELQCPDDSSLFVYTLTPPASTLVAPYEIAEVPVSPAGHTRSASISNGKIITLINQNTYIDYVFWRTTPQGDILKSEFYFLKITSTADEPPPTGPALTITIVPYVHPTDHTFAFNQTSATFTQAQAIAGLTINITAVTTPFTSFGWYYGANQLTTTAVLNNAALGTLSPPIDFTVSGSYEFIFVGVKDGVAYSGPFTIIIDKDVD
jgi:hypothetical protein